MHPPQHSKNPGLHTKSQLVPLQVETPFPGDVHGEQELPQLSMLESGRHCVPQR
jgi:hypothetical protein